MKNSLKIISLASLFMLTSLNQVAQASVISDATGNNTIVTAQDLNSAFSSTATPAGFSPLTNGLDWTTISALSGTDIDDGNGFNDYFSFTVEANATAYFDFDNFFFAHTGFVPQGGAPILEIFNASSSDSIASYSDNWSNIGFTTGDRDTDSKFLSYNFASAGTYTFGATGSCDFDCLAQSQGDSYTLNVAVDGLAGVSVPSVPVPEPSTIAVFTLALLGLGVRKYKMSK